MPTLPDCPKCNCEYMYEDRAVIVCPDCGHEFTADTETPEAPEGLIVLDANGTPLSNGDSITIAKGLKVKGAASDLKAGTKVKNIRLCEGDHNIDCKIAGFGAMKLKSEFVKKA